MCTSSLCKTCPTIIPQLLVECEVDVNLFKILYGRHDLDDTLGPDNPGNGEACLKTSLNCVDISMIYFKVWG